MQLERTATIDAPPEAVWPWLDDPERIKQWMTGLLEDVPTSEGPTGVGSTFLMKIQEGRQVVEYRGEILTWEPNRRLGIKLVGGCMGEMAMFVDYTLVDLGGQTRLEYTCRAEQLGLFWRLLTPLFKLIGGRQVRKFFLTLKQLVEEERAQPAGSPA